MTSKELYSRACESKRGVPVFLQPWWLDLVCPGWNAAVALKGEEIAGIWPFLAENKAGVSIIRTPMLTPYLGPHIFFPSDLKESRIDSFEHETIADLLSQMPDAKVWHLAMPPGLRQVGLFRHHKLKTDVQQTFLADLTQSEAALFANIKESARRNIKQAEKEIIITADPGSIEQLYAFQQNTLSAKGRQLTYTLSDLKKLSDACIARNAGTIWVARTGPVTEAIVWQVWDDQRSYYLMGGQNPEANGYKAMSLLLWHSIKESKKKGQQIFDFEGSMDQGVERFFRNFGARRELYVTLHKNESLLWKIKKLVLS